jgi:hypothetical protein
MHLISGSLVDNAVYSAFLRDSIKAGTAIRSVEMGMNVVSSTSYQRTVGGYLEWHIMVVSQIVILDVVDCEHRHQLDYRVVIQRHGFHIFVVDLVIASLLIVDRLL